MLDGLVDVELVDDLPEQATPAATPITTNSNVV
jgi:hypothetical protein